MQTQTQGQAVFPELRGAALIRELHVYGVIVPTYHGDSEEGPRPQHMGLGRRLVAHAERVALKAGYSKVAIIAGVGVRRYSVSVSVCLCLSVCVSLSLSLSLCYPLTFPPRPRKNRSPRTLKTDSRGP